MERHRDTQRLWSSIHPSYPMSFESRHLRACLRVDHRERAAWTFADLLRTPNGDGDPEAFDALCDTFCTLVDAPSCTVTDPDDDGRIWFAALAA